MGGFPFEYKDEDNGGFVSLELEGLKFLNLIICLLSSQNHL